MKTMKAITIGIVTMLLCLFAHPALADVITETKSTLYYTPWITADGVVKNGTKAINSSDNVIYSWLPEYQKNGVYYGAYVDQIYSVTSNENISLSPTQSCYYTGNDLSYCPPAWSSFNSFSNISYRTITNVLNIATFFIELTPNKIMTGASEFWYRSPLVYNDTDNDYTAHFLNIYDEAGMLVWASPYSVFTPAYPFYTNNPVNKTINDTSSYSGVGGERVYYKITMNLRGNVKYKFCEFVKTLGDVPVNEVKLYMCPAQDIASDDLTDTFCFVGTPNARKVPFECSWSAILTVGIGVSGTETIVYSNKAFRNVTEGDEWNENDGLPEIVTQTMQGTMIQQVQSIQVTLPLRTTKPLNISIFFYCMGSTDEDNDAVWSFGTNVTGVTGTLVKRFNILDLGGVGATNTYCLQFRITNFGEDGDAMSYYMYPSNGAIHEVFNGDGMNTTEFKHFAIHCEIVEYSDPVAADEDLSVTRNYGPWSWIFLIVGVILMIASVIITVVTGGLGVPFAVQLAIVGSAFFVLGVSGIMDEVMEAMVSGTARVLQSIGNAIYQIAGELWKLAVWVYETLVYVGQQILYWGALIMEALWQIIWLIAFIVVVWIWAKFLDIMKWVTLGNPSKALTTVTSVEGAGERAYKKGSGKLVKSYSNYKKVKRWYRGGK